MIGFTLTTATGFTLTTATGFGFGVALATMMGNGNVGASAYSAVTHTTQRCPTVNRSTPWQIGQRFTLVYVFAPTIRASRWRTCSPLRASSEPRSAAPIWTDGVQAWQGWQLANLPLACGFGYRTPPHSSHVPTASTTAGSRTGATARRRATTCSCTAVSASAAYVVTALPEVMGHCHARIYPTTQGLHRRTLAAMH